MRKEYLVSVENGHIYWRKLLAGIDHKLAGVLHREDGPAIIFSDGKKAYFLNGKEYSESEFKQFVEPTCDGKLVEIDGKKYQLKLIS